ncbi:MAG TPA: hypothetical protein VHB77_20090 [Planctomycetaceae bacterium]|nr:hypothetical protein [Planctomycetaceae bacterium]
MTHITTGTVRQWAWTLALCVGVQAAAFAQGQGQGGGYRAIGDDSNDGPPPAARSGYSGAPHGAHHNARNGQGGAPTLSEATAILESAVRALYKSIEPGDQPSPNELVAYADLRALRLYTGALEVAGWDLEQAANAIPPNGGYGYNNGGNGYNNGNGQGNNPGDGTVFGYRPNGNGNGGNGNGRPSIPRDDQSGSDRERYLAFRETVRTLLFRVRTTAVAVEHQVSFCDPQVAQAWQRDVVPALMDTIAATQPLFMEQESFVSYHVPGQQPRVIQTSTSGIPDNAVEVAANPEFQPYDGKGRGQGRYFVVKAFGGPIRVKVIRYRSHENAFGVLGTSVVRELSIDQIAAPNQPLFVPCNRDRFVDLSGLEIEWESADNRRKTFGSIDLVADRPQGQQQNDGN